jgi:hypothetical protein
MYCVAWSSRQMDSTFISSANMEGTLTNSHDEAMIFAEVLASEHAERLDVQYTKIPGGFHFRTNNASDVWYTVKKHTS